jgi:hypothetical protein
LGASGRPSSTRLSGSGAAVGGSSSVVIDVPGHAEATLRLHKARIKGLEDELSKLTQALAGKGHMHIAVCMMIATCVYVEFDVMSFMP